MRGGQGRVVLGRAVLVRRERSGIERLRREPAHALVRAGELVGGEDGDPGGNRLQDVAALAARHLAVHVERDAEDRLRERLQVRERRLSVGRREAELLAQEVGRRGRVGEGEGRREEGRERLEDARAQRRLRVDDVGDERYKVGVERRHEVGRVLAVAREEGPHLADERLPDLALHGAVGRLGLLGLVVEAGRERDERLAEVREARVGDGGLEEREEPRARLGRVGVLCREAEREEAQDGGRAEDLDGAVEDGVGLLLPLEARVLALLADEDEHLAQEGRGGRLADGRAQAQAQEERLDEREDVRLGLGGEPRRGEGLLDLLDDGARGRARGEDVVVGDAVADHEGAGGLDGEAQGRGGGGGDEGERRGENGAETVEGGGRVGPAERRVSASIQQRAPRVRREGDAPRVGNHALADAFHPAREELLALLGPLGDLWAGLDERLERVAHVVVRKVLGGVCCREEVREEGEGGEGEVLGREGEGRQEEREERRRRLRDRKGGRVSPSLAREIQRGSVGRTETGQLVPRLRMKVRRAMARLSSAPCSSSLAPAAALPPRLAARRASSSLAHTHWAVSSAYGWTAAGGGGEARTAWTASWARRRTFGRASAESERTVA